jgi:murein DD-endopeptidase MepM/ murein hydrolase activator NlpD
MGRLGERRIRLARAAAVVLAVLLLSCAHFPRGAGVFHTVRRGENLFRISHYYQVSVSSILEANQIRDERSVEIGERLWIPEARRSPPGYALLPPPASSGEARERARNDAILDGNLHFIWPLRGRLTAGFGFRNGRRHQGIDLAAKPGTLIRASEAGRVIYSGNGLGAYGNVVIVRHGQHYATVYAHNRKNRVRKGAFVDKGEVVAEVGKTGNATGPHLHFEIRRDEQACDPVDYLP